MLNFKSLEDKTASVLSAHPILSILVAVGISYLVVRHLSSQISDLREEPQPRQHNYFADINKLWEAINRIDAKIAELEKRIPPQQPNAPLTDEEYRKRAAEILKQTKKKRDELA